MSRFLLVSAAAGLLWAQPSIGQPFIELEGRYWLPQFHSKIRVEANGFGTDIDARHDLGFADANFPWGHAAVGWGNNRISFDYTPIGFSGDQVISRTLIFNGRTYTVGTRVISSLDAQHLQLAWSYRFRLLDGLVKVGPMVEADGFLLSGRLQAPAINLDSKEDLSAGLPTVGPVLEISPLPRLIVYGQATGMSAGGYGHFIGSEAGVHIRPIRHLQFTAGYRTFNLSVTNSPDFAHLHLGGPFVGGGFVW